jgi:predicted DNA-binding transcriptional regulator AlpA
MPARKYREGEELEEWEARKRSHELKMAIARETVKSLSGHTLMRLDEAAAMIGVTKKTLRELEAQNLPNWPQRVYISPKVTGYRLKDIEALIDSGMAPRETEAAE